MRVLRAAWLGNIALHRSLGLWVPSVLLAWILITKLQEPAFFRRQGIPFYWTNIHALLVMTLGLLPLLWRLSEGEASRRWLLARAHRGTVAITIFTILLYGVTVAFGVVLAAVSVDRILGSAASAAQILPVLLRSLGFLLCVSVLAPLLLRVRAPRTVLVTLWLLLLAGYVVWLQPRELLLADSDSAGAMAEITPVLQASCGGLLLSLAAQPSRPR